MSVEIERTDRKICKENLPKVTGLELREKERKGVCRMSCRLQCSSEKLLHRGTLGSKKQYCQLPI